MCIRDSITTGDYDKEMTTEALCIPTDKANSDAWPTELTEVKAEMCIRDSTNEFLNCQIYFFQII